MADTKRARVIVYTIIANLAKKILHKSLGMSRATVCRFIKQFNATGSVTPQRKRKVTEKGSLP